MPDARTACGGPPPSVRTVLAVVLDWNGLSLTRRCHAALREQTGRFRLSVVLVDNGSTAHSAEELAEACPGAEVIRAPKNLGFARGIAYGLARAKAARQPYDALWLLNNDCLPAPDALAQLLETLFADPKTGAVACLLSKPEDPALRGSDAPASMRLAPPLYIPRPGTPPDYLCGACLLISRRAWDTVGPLDPEFPFFFEDADWGMRARKAGFTLAIAPKARVVHLGSASIGRLGTRRMALYREGHVRFLRRHARHPLLAALPALLWRLAVDALHFRIPEIRGTLRGWKAGWAADASDNLP